MDEQQSTRKLPRPNLRVTPTKWSTSQNRNIASRVAIIGMVAAVFGGMGLVFLYPFLHIDRFRQIQKVNRAGINPEEVQPTGLPVWRDPFDRKKAA